MRRARDGTRAERTAQTEAMRKGRPIFTRPHEFQVELGRTEGFKKPVGRSVGRENV